MVTILTSSADKFSNLSLFGAFMFTLPSSTLSLYIDTVTETYPNPAHNIKCRKLRKTIFRFQSDNCDYFVDVIVRHAGPFCLTHTARIKIGDYTGHRQDSNAARIVDFISNDPETNVDIEHAGALAVLHLSQYINNK